MYYDNTAAATINQSAFIMYPAYVVLLNFNAEFKCPLVNCSHIIICFIQDSDDDIQDYIVSPDQFENWDSQSSGLATQVLLPSKDGAALETTSKLQGGETLSSSSHHGVYGPWPVQVLTLRNSWNICGMGKGEHNLRCCDLSKRHSRGKRPVRYLL